MNTNFPPGPPPVNNMFQLMRMMMAIRKSPLDSLMDLRHAFGRTFSLEVMGDSQIWTSDPDFTRDVLITHAADFQKDAGYTNEKRGLARFLGSGLLTSNGDFWKRQRKLVSPALHAKRIEAYAGTMVDYTQQQLQGWQDGAKQDISREMTSLTMRIVAKSLFNTEVMQVVNMVHQALEDIQQWAVGIQFSPLPTWLPTPMELKMRRAKRNLDAFIFQTIHERRASGEDNGDLLSMLLLAEDDDGNHMTDLQARDEIVTLFLAGHETTANNLNWTWMLLAQHPEVEAKLHAELDRVLAGRLPTLADLPNLPYTEMVIKESMRLYPPAYSFSRESLKDLEIGGYTLPKGTVVNIFTYAMHHDPNLWDTAAAFIPERWIPDNEAKMHRYQYIPFGGGARICIGNSFALMEARLILATIASRYRLTLDPGQTVELLPVITLNPKNGLPMTVRRRTPQPQPQAELSAVIS